MKVKLLQGKSLRFRINLWYTILMCVLSLALIVSVVAAAGTAERSMAQQDLIRSVERNIDEIEVESGILDIESDFAFVNEGVHAIVFSSDGNILGGEYPDGVQIDVPLENGRFDIVDGYYVYDSHIEFKKYEYKIHGVTGAIISEECDAIQSFTPFEGDLDQIGADCVLTHRDAVEIALTDSGIDRATAELIMVGSYDYNDEPLYEIEFYSTQTGHDDIWVRGVARAENTGGIWSTIAKIACVLAPLITIISSLVGGFIAKRAMQPVNQLSEAVAKTHSGNDLTTRIEFQDTDPALKTLADNFNAMFQRLHSSFESQRQFNADVSHELRTPTAVILAECEYQLTRDDLSAEDRESLETVKKQALSMKEIISQLLYFSRIEQGNEKPVLEKEDFSELVLAVCDDTAALNTKNITLKTDIQKDIFLDLDIVMMTRLVTNLVSNAYTYGKENGNILVTLKRENSGIVLTVADDGIGIKAEDLEKIWQRFYRVDKARSRQEGSSGLGLPMVKQIAVLHGACVSCKSEFGKGSEFKIIF